MRLITNIRHAALLPATLAACLDEVPDGDLTEEELAGEGQPDETDGPLIIESGIGGMAYFDDEDGPMTYVLSLGL